MEEARDMSELGHIAFSELGIERRFPLWTEDFLYQILLELRKLNENVSKILDKIKRGE